MSTPQYYSPAAHPDKITKSEFFIRKRKDAPNSSSFELVASKPVTQEPNVSNAAKKELNISTPCNTCCSGCSRFSDSSLLTAFDSNNSFDLSVCKLLKIAVDSSDIMFSDKIKSNTRLKNAKLIWNSMAATKKRKYPQADVKMISAEFVGFFTKIFLFIYNMLHSTNTSRTEELLESIAGARDYLEIALYNKKLSDVMVQLFKNLNRDTDAIEHKDDAESYLDWIINLVINYYMSYAECTVYTN